MAMPAVEAFGGLWGTSLAAGAVLIIVSLALLPRRRRGEPPIVPGLPLLGNALGLGHHGVAYISHARQKFGDAFTLVLGGVRMTYLFAPQHLHYFFSAPEDQVTFRPAVEQFTQRVFGLTSKQFFPLHAKMLGDLRQMLVPGALPPHLHVIGTRTLQLLPSYAKHAQVDLYALCRSLVLHAGVEALFGAALVGALPSLLPGRGAGGAARGRGPRGGERSGGGAAQGAEEGSPAEVAAGVSRFAAAFYAFEEGFELAASPVPHAFQPAFTSARRTLLAVLGAADAGGMLRGTPAGELLERTSGLPRRLRPNLLLAVLWASLANTVPATFWCVAFLLLPENRAHRAEVLAELQAEMLAACGADAPSPAGPSPPAALPATPSIPLAAPSSRRLSPRGSVGATGAVPLLSRAPSPSALLAAATRLACSRRSAVARCVAETLRLRVQSIDVRIAATDLELPPTDPADPAAATGATAPAACRLRIPRGRLLAVCPFESHHDAALYGGGDKGGGGEGRGRPGPWSYDPGRPELRLGDGGAVMPSVAGLAFGGGPWRCPGRFLAEAELGLLTQLLLAAYDMHLSYGNAAAAAAASSNGSGGSGDGAPAGAEADAAAPQLGARSGGSHLYNLLAALAGPAALAWGTGWFDGLDGRLQDWRHSGDPGGLLPPCDLRRLVGLKVPRKPCWVQLWAQDGAAVARPPR